MKGLFLFFDVMEKVVKILVAILIGGMVMLICLQVGFRYILNQPLTWTEEVARHLMIWAALLGAAVAYRRKGHLGMDVIVVQFNKRWQGIVEEFVHLVSVGFFGLLVFNGIPLVEKTMHQFSSAIRIPMGYIYASIPVGSALILLFAVEKLIGFYKKKEVPEAPRPL